MLEVCFHGSLLGLSDRPSSFSSTAGGVLAVREARLPPIGELKYLADASPPQRRTSYDHAKEDTSKQ
jgi:hypothetical protein